MNQHEEMELRIWSFLDGEGTEEERSVIERLIREQAEWKALYGELLEVHEGLQATELDEPSMRFTRNVMEAIGQAQIAPAAKTYINKRVVWGIGIFFITMLIGFLVYGVAQINWSAAGSNSNPLGVDLGKVDYSPFFSSTLMNGFLMINIIAGLFLLDRWLGQKRDQYRSAGPQA